MIFTITYSEVAREMSIGGFANPSKKARPWEAMRKCMEGTKDIIIFLVTRQQSPSLMTDLRDHGLDKYLIVDHRRPEVGITNRNYPEDKLRLKLFVLEGAKQ